MRIIGLIAVDVKDHAKRSRLSRNAVPANKRHGYCQEKEEQLIFTFLHRFVISIGIRRKTDLV